jgi:hypothetical protein
LLLGWLLGLLLGELLFEGGFAGGDDGAVALWIEPDGVAFAGHAGELFEEVEVVAVVGEEDLCGEAFVEGEGVAEVVDDAWVGGGLGGGVDEAVVGPEGVAADDDDGAEGCGGLAGEMGAEGPGGAAAGVACGAVRGEGGGAEGDGVVVVEDAVDGGGGKVGDGAGGAEEVGVAAGLDDRDVVGHDHEAGVGFALDLCGAAGVIEVGLAGEEDAGVAPVEAELLDGGTDLGWGGWEVGVDEDVAGGGGDEVGGEILAADVEEIVGDAERCDGGGPDGFELGGEVGGEAEDQEGKEGDGLGARSFLGVGPRAGHGPSLEYGVGVGGEMVSRSPS